jgi:malate dehydrogenase (quinone)/L-2-hydroxyglutarate oxidase
VIDEPVDVCIVGGGIVGLATAFALTRQRPDSRIILLERESGWGRHQTGHNSGVIHSGIYYAPGSLKARLTRQGLAAMYDFCRQEGLPAEQCGKVIVATDEAALSRLEDLRLRGEANGVEVHSMTGDELRRREPFARGIAALHVPETGITDYGRVAERLAELLRDAGVELRLDTHVEHVTNEHPDYATVRTAAGAAVRARKVMTAAGVHSDQLARASGARPPASIVPFRGEYFELRADRRHLVRHLIYPVPDPDLPFLGVHFTRSIDGGVHVGPNAVLALSRDGYRRRDVDAATLRELWRTPGLRQLARRYWRVGAGEVSRSLFRSLFVPHARRLVPDVRAADLAPATAGVRAQALDDRGNLLDDFLFHRDGRCLHVINAPSPAATASLAIGEEIARELLDTLA